MSHETQPERLVAHEVQRKPFEASSLRAVLAFTLAAAMVAQAAVAGGADPSAAAPATTDGVNTLRRADDGLYFMDFEGSKSKGTVVEFETFVVLIEVPVADEGGGARRLDDHQADGEKVLRTLRLAFPGKPLRYVLSSHWHPHSLSALRPFLAAGTTVITTRANFDRLREMLGPNATGAAQAPDGLQFIDSERFEIRDARNAIVAHRFEKKDYPATPTDDYLFFHLPRYDALHCGCMYSKWTGPPVDGRPLLTAREEDLQAFIVRSGLQVRQLIRLNREPNGTDERLPYARLAEVAAHGIRSQELAERYRPLTLDALRTRRAELVARALAGGIPARTFNTLAYECAARNDLARAVEFATLQALIAPKDPNAWDSLGEMYYLAGEVDAARALEKTSREVDPEFKEGGEAAWKENLERFTKEWQALK
jgi:hypothetical protein